MLWNISIFDLLSVYVVIPVIFFLVTLTGVRMLQKKKTVLDFNLYGAGLFLISFSFWIVRNMVLRIISGFGLTAIKDFDSPLSYRLLGGSIAFFIICLLLLITFVWTIYDPKGNHKRNERIIREMLNLELSARKEDKNDF